MSQIKLAGKGGPIPNVALPDPNIDPNMPVQTLELEDGYVFRKEDWVGLGYTRYEVWCIGACGGRGGAGGGRSNVSNSAPTPLEHGLSIDWPYYFTRTIPGDPVSPLLTHWHHPRIPPKTVRGGAGGGGGLHVVSGLLVDLPDACPIVVGQAGDDAPIGQVARPELYQTTFADTPGSYGVEGVHDVYDEPHLAFGPPVAGEDGGTSSFNGTMCQASGGKGGKPCTQWVNNVLMVTGHGGDGGSGGRNAAGGGGSGSLTKENGSDGTWDGSIGKGGGGGRGGVPEEDPYRPMWSAP